MNLYVRLAYAICVGLIADRLDYRRHLLSSYRVWPHDLDAFGHMNNGRYLQIMDVARTEWMARAGVLGCMWQQRWSAVLGGGFVRFRRSLRPFQRYRVRTRLLTWDDRWWYLEHCFFDLQGEQVASGVSRAALRSNDNWVPTAQIIELVHPGAAAPQAPAYLRNWLHVEHEMWDHSQCCVTRAAMAVEPPFSPALHEREPGG